MPSTESQPGSTKVRFDPSHPVALTQGALLVLIEIIDSVRSRGNTPLDD